MLRIFRKGIYGRQIVLLQLVLCLSLKLTTYINLESRRTDSNNYTVPHLVSYCFLKSIQNIGAS